MNPFRKRSKSAAGDTKKARRNAHNGTGSLPGSPQIISTAQVAFSLPSENDFRTSLLMPKMADRFSLLRVNEAGQVLKQMEIGREESPNQHFGMHARDLSILEEGDEEDEELPVRPWERRERQAKRGAILRDGMSKDEFIRVRAQD